MRKFLALHRNVRVRIGLAFVHKLIVAIYLASRMRIATTGALILLFAVFTGKALKRYLREKYDDLVVCLADRPSKNLTSAALA
jgi:DHA1 family multidrug resistance protein B-like MFS transporter